MTAALALIDAQGLAKFSVNALAVEMGAIQPNMYRRISGRQELLDLVVDEIMAEAGLPEIPTDDWHAWLADWGVRVRRAWRAHPRAGALIHHGSSGSRASVDAVIGVFLRAFPPDFVGIGLQAYLAQVFGATLLETRSTPDSESQEAPRAQPELAALPHLRELARLEAERLAGRDASADATERDFLQGLTILLDGFRPHSRA